MSNLVDDFKTDLPHYQWGLLTLVLTLAICGTAVALSQGFLTRAQDAHNAAQKQLSEARKNLSAAQDDRANMTTYAEEYEQLLKRNIIGNEQRLDWIDGLETLRKQNVVIGFTYTIAPQQAYKPPAALDSGNFTLNASEMKLSLYLLHEGQLVNFFNALRINIKGQFLLDGCTIGRLDKTSNTTPGISPQLKAECRGEWLTLKNKGAP
jgi:hypothetical protein